MFVSESQHNVEAYVDDVVVKTKTQDQFIADLEETLNSLRKFRWKLNTTKCVFGVPSGKLLRFIVSHRGIEANPEKINAIMAMDAPATIKDVQKLTGYMAALNRFLSRLGEQYHSSSSSNDKTNLSGLQKPRKHSRISSITSSHHQFL